ncbi:signal recognition particle subunit SRP68 [Diabrotica undecimpunctata]|uniref:signal recognition particle subunit SRP68 n=1 Tax=Diabrotica undecimpunctata TaxID=50387 RepID=UPI003B639091
MGTENIDYVSGDTQNKPSQQEPLLPFTLEILKLIKDCQQQHGLRHGDYQRYRGYCSRRISRLRKVLKIPQGDRRHFKKRDVTEAHIINPKSDDRFLHIPLILAERNWAYAMQLRQEANTEPRKKFHLVQKMRKACVYALQLDELCKQDRCDVRTKLESQAYLAWIQGSLQFELQLWQQAAENLKKAQVIYEKISSTLPEEEQLPYKQRVEEISPSLRYCAYNIGDEKAVDLLELRSQGVLEKFDALVSQNKEKNEDVLYEVKWFNLKIPVRIERIRLFLVSIEGLNESLNHAEDNQGRIKILENLFIDLRDIISLARDNSRSDKLTAKQTKEYQQLIAYLLSIRIERTSQRNVLLILQTRKPQDCVRLLDINIQQTNELSQNDIIKGNTNAQKYYESQIAAYKTLRYYYLAKSQGAQKRWKEAAVLFDTAYNSAQVLKQGKFELEVKEILQRIEDKSQIDIATAKANMILDQKQDESTIQFPQSQKTYKSKKPLVERLDEFREDPQLLSKNPNLVTLPPAMEPVPAKPLFFDLALNFAEFPDLSEKLDDGKPKQKQGAGISGFVKGLWGWGK